MRHLLVVSYYFPPMGGVPVRRLLRFLRHLPAHGWRCSVLTADRPYDPFHPQDPEGLSEVPPVERVLRAPARAGVERVLSALRRCLVGSLNGVGDTDPGRKTPRLVELRQRLHEGSLHPDAKRFWIRGAGRTARQALVRDPPDVVLATGYPWSAFVAGARLAREGGVPLVLDYRDAWSTNPRQLWSGPRCRAHEARILSEAAAVVAATEGLADSLRQAFRTAPRPWVVGNGFDPAELPERDPGLADPERMLLVYTGTFNDALPPSLYDQTPYYLLEALALLGPEVRSGLRVRLVGRVGRAYRRWIRERGLGDVVEVEGPVRHQRALQQQEAADVLLVVVCSGQGSQGVLTGKVLEYLGARRPILALAPEGELANFVRKRSLGRVEPPEDVARIARAISDLVSEYRAGTLPRELPLQHDASAPARTAALAAVLERVAAWRTDPVA